MSNKILVIGANGKIGTMLVKQLAASNHDVVAMVRNKMQCALPTSVEIIEADLESDIAAALQGCNCVVFTAGSGAKTGFDKTLLVDLWGAKKAIDTAKTLGVAHFIMVSARGAGSPDDGPAAIKPYLVAKHFADTHLIDSGLNYTILRPGRLTDDNGTGLINTTRPIEASEQYISRADTTNVIAYCIENDATFGKIYELFAGTEPIKGVII